MKHKLDMDEIASSLGAERLGKVEAEGGYFGAMQLAADVQARFKRPRHGGRATDPKWTRRRQIALSEATLRDLGELANAIGEQGEVHIEPLQLAAILLEQAVARIDKERVTRLVRRTTARPTARQHARTAAR